VATTSNPVHPGEREDRAILDELSKEELVQRIQELREELRLSQAFSNISEGAAHDATLLWRGRNRFLAERIIPVRLKGVPGESLNTELATNRIIDGDNLAVMASLLTEFRGGPTRGFDVIYMDPPYNTGEDVFSYNDNYSLSRSEIRALRRTNGRAEALVSLDDPSRHTKWINHIAPRLWAAKKLMKSTGVIIVSIDEHELPRLWMLMEEIFGERNRIATLIWERSRKNDAAYISEGHEYMLLWARSKADLDARRAQMGQQDAWAQVNGRWRKKKEGADQILTAYEEAKSMYGSDVASIQKALDEFFAGLPKEHPVRAIRFRKVDAKGVYNDDGNLNWPGGGGPRYDVPHPVTGKPVKQPKSGWRYQEPEMQRLIAEGRIAFKATHRGVPRFISYLHELESEVQTSVISRSGQRSVELLEAVLGKGVFKNPKDPEILADLINLVTWRDKEAVILDPYAGSGTTGHAVLSMNAEDEGNRRFVLIEGGDARAGSSVARDNFTARVTAERLRRIITGEWADGSRHARHETGFDFFRAQEQITRSALMASKREALADVVLQVIEDDSNRIDCRVEGHEYLIGRTRSGAGIALVWQPGKASGSDQLLTWDVLERILDEAAAAKAQTPVHIYAIGNTAPLSEELYRFHQIPNSILARLGVMDGDEESLTC
jgi:adenine-specific DNA-methyltransferase